MQLKQLSAILMSAGCLFATGCGAAAGTDESSASVLWLNIEPAQEDEFGKATYEDGLYLSQTVKEPAPDPFADDTKLVREGTTDEGIRYALYQEHAEITGHTEQFEADELVIPETISGLPVTRICSVAPVENNQFEMDKSGAFYSCYTLSKVTVPEGMYEIGDYAFYGCKNLHEIEIPESVMHIGARAFAMCSSLTALTVPSGIDTIGEGAFALTPWYDDLLFHRDLIIFNGRLYDAGKRCTGEVIVPDYVVSVSDYAFYSCLNLTAVVLPERVQSIGKNAFSHCPKLRSLVIPNPDCEIYDDAATVSNKTNGGGDEYYIGVIYCEQDSAVSKFAEKYKFRCKDTDQFSLKDEKSK